MRRLSEFFDGDLWGTEAVGANNSSPNRQVSEGGNREPRQLAETCMPEFWSKAAREEWKRGFTHFVSILVFGGLIFVGMFYGLRWWLG